MKILFCLCLVSFLTGCVAGRVVQTRKDGSKTSAWFARAFASTDSYKFTLTETNATLEAKNSKVDGKGLGVAAGTAGKIMTRP